MTPVERKANGSGAITAAEWRRRLQETDKLEPSVTIRLRGNDYTLEYTNRTIKDVLLTTGKNIIRQGISREDLQDPDYYSMVLFQGLHKHHPDLTLDQVDELIDHRHYVYITAQVIQALSLFMPDMSDTYEEQPGQETSDKDPT